MFSLCFSATVQCMGERACQQSSTLIILDGRPRHREKRVARCFQRDKRVHMYAFCGRLMGNNSFAAYLRQQFVRGFGVWIFARTPVLVMPKQPPPPRSSIAQEHPLLLRVMLGRSDK